MKDNIFDISPMINEICEDYIAVRKCGKSRDEAIKELRNMYYNEFNDRDDAPYAQIALALVLCKNRELTKPIADEATLAIEVLEPILSNENDLLQRMKRLIADINSYGDESKYSSSKVFAPKWSVGDTFVHVMDNAVAETIGINGWCIIIRKTGSYINNMGQEVQIVLLAICRPDKIPTNTEEVNSLRYLKMMPINKQKCDYNAQILITKKREETQFGLKKIGCFPDADMPDNQADTDPRTAMPLFGFKGKDGCMHYEMIACTAFKDSALF